jgi:hypothetical protein
MDALARWSARQKRKAPDELSPDARHFSVVIALIGRIGRLIYRRKTA